MHARTHTHTHTRRSLGSLTRLSARLPVLLPPEYRQPNTRAAVFLAICARNGSIMNIFIHRTIEQGFPTWGVGTTWGCQTQTQGVTG